MKLDVGILHHTAVSQPAIPHRRHVHTILTAAFFVTAKMKITQIFTVRRMNRPTTIAATLI